MKIKFIMTITKSCLNKLYFLETEATTTYASKTTALPVSRSNTLTTLTREGEQETLSTSTTDTSTTQTSSTTIQGRIVVHQW